MSGVLALLIFLMTFAFANTTQIVCTAKGQPNIEIQLQPLDQFHYYATLIRKKVRSEGYARLEAITTEDNEEGFLFVFTANFPNGVSVTAQSSEGGESEPWIMRLSELGKKQGYFCQVTFPK